MKKIIFPILLFFVSQSVFANTPYPLNALGSGTGNQGIDVFFPPVMSSDGQYIAFASGSNDLITGLSDSNGVSDVFLFNVKTSELKLVSHIPSSSNTTANALSYVRDISNDGRYVLIESAASNLITGFTDNNGEFARDIYVWDRETDEVKLVSAAPDSSTEGADAQISSAYMSGDGSAVTFVGNIQNLVSGLDDINGSNSDVFYRSLVTDTTFLASHHFSNPVQTGNFFSFISSAHTISDDGKKIAYLSTSTQIVNGITPTYNVYLYDADTGINSLVSHNATSLTDSGNSFANNYALTADGNYVFFDGTASNHISTFVNNNGTNEEVYSYRASDGALSLVSHAVSSANEGPNEDCGVKATNFDGSVIALECRATNLVSGISDTNSDYDVFVVESGVTTQVSLNALGEAPNAYSGSPVLSPGGRYLSFVSIADDLTSNDVNGFGSDVFIMDLKNSTLTCLSRIPDNTQTTNDDSYYPVIGRNSYAFVSEGSNLVANDLNGALQDGYFTLFNLLALSAPVAPQIVDSATVNISGQAESGSLVRIYSDANNNNVIDSTESAIYEEQLADGVSDFTFTNVPLTQRTANNFLVVSVDAAGFESFAEDVPTITDVPTFSAKIKTKKNGRQILIIKNELGEVLHRKAPFGKFTGKIKVKKVDLNADGILDIRVTAKINGKKKARKFNGIDLTLL